MLNPHAKYVAAMRHQLIGAKMFRALTALEMVLLHHTGLRRDKVTPNHMHPLRVAQLGMTMQELLMHKEESICVFLLHDVCEDCNIPSGDITGKFGELVGTGVECLTKEFRGVKKPPAIYFEQMSMHPLASVGKGLDRISNLNDMVGVFTPAKQLAYVEEAEFHILPMLKRARKMFPQQYWVYENIKLHMRSQIALIKAMHPVVESNNSKDQQT